MTIKQIVGGHLGEHQTKPRCPRSCWASLQLVGFAWFCMNFVWTCCNLLHLLSAGYQNQNFKFFLHRPLLASLWASHLFPMNLSDKPISGKARFTLETGVLNVYRKIIYRMFKKKVEILRCLQNLYMNMCDAFFGESSILDPKDCPCYCRQNKPTTQPTKIWSPLRQSYLCMHWINQKYGLALAYLHKNYTLSEINEIRKRIGLKAALEVILIY